MKPTATFTDDDYCRVSIAAEDGALTITLDGANLQTSRIVDLEQLAEVGRLAQLAMEPSTPKTTPCPEITSRY